MRTVVIDTETTGFSPKNGDRVIEVAAVEVVAGRPTGQEFVRRVDPQVKISEGASRVHGIYDRDVVGLPAFCEIVDELLLFIGDCQLVGHNIDFDLSFLDNENRFEYGVLSPQRWEEIRRARRPVCTMKLARAKLKSRSFKLSAVAEKLGLPVPTGLHSAIVDARLTAEVYTLLTAGEQEAFDLTPREPAPVTLPTDWPPLVLSKPGLAELKAHEAFCDLNKLKLF